MERIRSTIDELREDLGPLWLLKSIGYVLLALLVFATIYVDIVLLFSLGGQL